MLVLYLGTWKIHIMITGKLLRGFWVHQRHFQDWLWEKPWRRTYFSRLDFDYARYIDEKKSTSRYTFHLGYGPISWSSKKQSKYYFHQQRKNISVYQRHLKKLYGSEDYFKKHIINKLVQPPYSKTTKAPSRLQRILYTMPALNTLKFIITSFMT